MASYDEYKKMLAQQNQQQNQSLNYGLANSGPAAGMNGLSGANATGHIDAPGNAVNLPNNGNATGHVNMPWKGIDLPYGGNTGNTGGNATGHLDTPGTAINFPRGGDTGGNATGHIPGNGQPYSPQSWSDRVAELYDQITNRPKFSYDPNSDGLYQNYKDLYTQAGRRAMEDTMGQAAGLTGGYGSTYSQAVGQQQYGDYMTRLNAELPNLYAQARAAYDKEGDDLWNRYNMAMNMEQQEYNRGRDALADERYENEWNYQKEQDAYNRERQERLDAADRAYQEWQMGRADRSDARDLVLTMIQAGKTPPADMLEAAGISLSYAQTMASYYASQMNGYGGSGGGGGKGGSGGRGGRGGRGGGGGTGGSGGTGGGGSPGQASVIKPSQYNSLVQQALSMDKDDFDAYFQANFGDMINAKEVYEYIKKQIANYGNGPSGGGGGKARDITR